MDQYEHIRTMSRLYKKGIRQIARETGHSRVTIRKVLAGQKPEYRRSKKIKRPVIGPYEELIKEWLVGDQSVRKKQRHTAKRMYDRLVEENGFKGSESAVRAYVRTAREEIGLSLGEAMVPLEADMGEAEMDWGEAVVILGGEEVKVKMFCMRSKYSGKPFVRLYRNERQQMLLDGHVHAFAYFGGVFPMIIYDNLKTVVKRVLLGSKRLEQREFQHFRSHYTFEAKFCNVARGNEKGGVEGLVGFSRRNFLVPIPKAETLEALNEELAERCEAYTERMLGGRETRETVAALAEEECEMLMPLVAPYETAIPRKAKINKYQMIQVDGNRYSTPGGVGKVADVLLGCRKVRIFQKGKLIAEHERVFGKGRWVMEPLHYLKLLEKKVRAFENARPIREWRKKWPSIYESLLEKLRSRLGEADGTRGFLRVLRLHEEHEADDVQAAVVIGWENGIYHADGIRLLLQQFLEKEEAYPEALSQERLPLQARLTLKTPELSKYDQLTGSVA